MKNKLSFHGLLGSKWFFPLLLLGAFLVRVLWLDLYPAGIQQDEAFAGWFAYTLGEYGIDNFGYGFPVYFTAWGSGMNALYSYLSIPFVKLLGLNVWAIRLPQAIWAFLSILAFYGIIKRTISRELAVIVTFLWRSIHGISSCAAGVWSLLWFLHFSCFPPIFSYWVQKKSHGFLSAACFTD